MKYVITNQLVPIKRTLREGYEFRLKILNITFNTAKEVESFIKNNASDVGLDFLVDIVRGDIDVYGISYPASIVMRRISQSAYKELFKEFINSLDFTHKIDKMSVGETINIFEFEIKAEK